MNKIVVDTDIFIDHLRGFPQAKKFFENIMDFIVFFSAITEAELLSGKDCNKIEKRNEIIKLLNSATKINVDNIIAKKAGELRRIYNIESISDSIIAATAFVMKAKLVTRNIKDFEKIKEISIKIPY